MKAMGESLDRGHVMIFSLWDDVEVNMLWLDSAYPLDKPATDPGVQRGDCVGGESSTPTYLRKLVRHYCQRIPLHHLLQPQVQHHLVVVTVAAVDLQMA